MLPKRVIRATAPFAESTYRKTTPTINMPKDQRNSCFPTKKTRLIILNKKNESPNNVRLAGVYFPMINVLRLLEESFPNCFLACNETAIK